MDLYLAGVSASVKFNNPIVYIRWGFVIGVEYEYARAE